MSTVGYAAVHWRIQRDRGKARDYMCQCGSQAEQWAYKHPTGYSENVYDYDPLCRSCHRKKDNPATMLQFVCPICSTHFSIARRQYQNNQIKQGKAGPFCSKKCAGIYSTRGSSPTRQETQNSKF